MAIAQFTLICPTCGKEFEVRTVRQNRTACKEFEEWARKYPWNCPECFKAEAKAERAADTERIEAKYHLPAIEGVSEKQIAYASRLRYEAFKDREKDIDKTIELQSELTDEQIQQICEACSVDRSEIPRLSFETMLLGKIYSLLTESRASKIIDIALKPNP